MTLLILGLLLWVVPHMFKRLAPAQHAQMGSKMRPIVAVSSLIGLVLMVIGYRAAEGTMYWGRTSAMVGINNLLMVAAFYLFAVSGPKGARVWVGTKIRHPMLLALIVWAVAHLLVNGDTPSFVLFGGLLVWAVATIRLINSQEPAWTPPARAPMKKEVIYIVASVVATGVVMALHNALGAQPWG